VDDLFVNLLFNSLSAQILTIQE